MAGGLADASRSGLRARRWDVIVLGSGITGLMAAARLCDAGRRVLVLEEERAHDLFPGLREPFFLAGGRDEGVLDAALRALKLALLDRRRVEPERIAYQLVARDLRLDVGEADLTADELVAWGLAKPDEARALSRALFEASRAELDVLFDAPLVRASRRIGLPRSRVGSHVRGLPAEVAQASPAISRLLAAQTAALSNLALAEPTPEARARLLGSALSGGVGYRGGPPWLVGTLRRRVESLLAEFRSLDGDFELVTAQGLPAIAVPRSGDLWLARALVLACPTSALAATMGDRCPRFLAKPAPTTRRLSVHLRVARDQLPEGMADRVVLLDERKEVGAAIGQVTLNLHSIDAAAPQVDLVARARVSADQPIDEAERRIEDRVRRLFPFAGEALARQPVARPRWDDDDLLEDPPPGGAWPGEFDLRISSRPLLYRLDRSSVAGLGVEGDLLLGWRGGDAIAADLG